MTDKPRRKKHPELTSERLRELLSYDPETGEFRWLVQRKRAKAGDIAGCLNGDGYWIIKVNNRIYLAHRLAWLYVHGQWPTDGIDHRNGVRSENRISNLRKATSAENNQNRSISRRNKSGHIGVCWHTRDCKWEARIMFSGRAHSLGCFSSIEDAIAARAKAKAQLHQFQPFNRGEK